MAGDHDGDLALAAWRRASFASGALSAGSNPGVRFWERNGSGQPRTRVARCGQLDRAQCSDQRMNPSSGPLFQTFARFGTKKPRIPQFGLQG
jgi:hypothetical protein